MKKAILILLIVCNITLYGNELKLKHPNGNEKFVIGSDTLITWEGVAPTDTVKLEYSIDNDVSWQLLTESAVGLQYKWENIPKPPSDSCRVKISRCTKKNFDTLPTIEWGKCYGGTASEKANSIIQTTDGSYIVVGYSSSNDGDVLVNKGDTDAWILKLDNSGNIKWSKCYGGSGSDVANSIIPTTDGGYIVVGSTNSNDGDVLANKGGTDAWILKLDKNGNIKWSKCYGGSGSDVANSIIPTTDGGYIVAGNSNSTDGDVASNKGATDAWIFKLDKNGNIGWSKCYGGKNIDEANAVISTLDSGYVVVGSTSSSDGDVSSNHGIRDAWVLKLNYQGNIEWSKCYGGSRSDAANSIIQVSDGSYVVVGFATSADGDVVDNKGEIDAWVLKLNYQGNIEWSKCYGGTKEDKAMSIYQIFDGDYIVAGCTKSRDVDITNNKGLYNSWIFKIDKVGDIKWQQCYGGRNWEESNSIIQTNDIAYVVAGFGNSSKNTDFVGNKGTWDFTVMKLVPVYEIISDQSDAVFSIVAPLAKANDIDMHQCFLGAAKDSIIVDFISNVGSYKLRVDTVYFQGADAAAFSLVSAFSKYEISAGDNKASEVRFVPSRLGLHNAEVVIVTQSDTLIRKIKGTGTDSIADIRLELKNCATKTNENIIIPVFLSCSEKFLSPNTLTISFDLSFNPTLLYPLDYTCNFIDNKSATLSIKDIPLKIDSLDILTNLRFKTALGNAEFCDLVLSNVSLKGGKSKITTIDGTFTLLDICNEGGVRLVNPNAGIAIPIQNISPNPANNKLDVTVKVVEENAVIRLLNSAGLAVRELSCTVDKSRTQTLQIDLRSLSSGVYFIEFRSANYIQTEKIIIGK